MKTYFSSSGVTLIIPYQIKVLGSHTSGRSKGNVALPLFSVEFSKGTATLGGLDTSLKE